MGAQKSKPSGAGDVPGKKKKGGHQRVHPAQVDEPTSLVIEAMPAGEAAPEPAPEALREAPTRLESVGSMGTTVTAADARLILANARAVGTPLPVQVVTPPGSLVSSPRVQKPGQGPSAPSAQRQTTQHHTAPGVAQPEVAANATMAAMLEDEDRSPTILTSPTRRRDPSPVSPASSMASPTSPTSPASRRDFSPARRRDVSPASSSGSVVQRRRVGAQKRACSRDRRQLRIETISSCDGASTFKPDGYRSITWCDNFSEIYTLGESVMPSVHRHMEIRFAVPLPKARPADVGWELPTSGEVVVKVRYKRGAFTSRSTEKAWRASTECLLNLPAFSGIARIYEVLEDKIAYYVVMEKVPGKDLHERLHKEFRIPVEEVKEVLRQLLQGVAELHASGCIHRDIKLENVMFDRTTRQSEMERAPSLVSVGTAGRHSSESTRTSTPTDHSMSPRRAGPADWASCCSGSASGPGYSRAASKVTVSPTCGGGAAAIGTVKLIDFDTVQEWSPQSTRATDVLGTDQYIAPEAYEGRYSPASDIFAVGVIAYKLLTRSFPFRKHIFDDKPGENWVGSPKMREIRERLVEERLDWRHSIFHTEQGARSLVARMLAMDERLRPTAWEALGDPWLNSRSCQPSANGLSSLWVPIAQPP
uniref:Protein kinase domain-containing protein n=1 Tax=Pyrodinium bahamense TaxID=73915 RepID=A0A7S0F999_9DINO|mmetsp:Transcript_13496/g.37377  ORF Transcript_13496/g.37377 Transcript_13496/m.37377 type:complete len:648 (+) Transcript_13496:60-2003(+)